MVWVGEWTPAGAHELLPAGELKVTAGRELIGTRGALGAREPGGAVAEDTLPMGAQLPPLLGGQSPDAPIDEVVEVHEEEVVWGGGISGHFGHFLIETPARLWPLLPGGPLEGRQVVFRKPASQQFATDWMAGFGVQPIYLPEHGAARFKRMHVPEQAWRIGAWIAPELRDIHLQARAGLELPSVPRRDVLWLSRSRLVPERIPYDEALLEWILDGHVTPVHLEAMTLAEQVATLEASRAVVGVLGSAFHGLLLTTHTPDALYLGPSTAKGPYPEQHRLLDGKATFLPAVIPTAKARRARRRRHMFPAAHRILIPQTLQALSSTVLPDLFEDPRIAAFAQTRHARRSSSSLNEIEKAVVAVLRDPSSTGPRQRLSGLFAERGLERCAAEQSAMATACANPAPGRDKKTQPRGALSVAEPREQLVLRRLPGAFAWNKSRAPNTLWAYSEVMRLRHLPLRQSSTEDVVRTHEEDVLWGGNVLDAFGHFLRECASRLWPALPGAKLEGLPVVYTTPCDPPFAHEWMEAFGATVVDLPERGAVRFKRMHVAEPAWRLDAAIAPEARDVYLHARRGLRPPPVPARDVLWLSRSRLVPERIPYDEALLEWILDGHVTPVHLEAMTLAEQVATLEASRAVAGAIDSAFHALLLTASPPASLYLCPPAEKAAFQAQQQLLDSPADFAQTLHGTMRMRASRRRSHPYPGGFRLSIPETLRAFGATVLPTLLEDRRLAAFAEPASASRAELHRALEDEIDLAVLRVLREPFSSEERTRLGAMFEQRGAGRRAREQYALAADLSEEG